MDKNVFWIILKKNINSDYYINFPNVIVESLAYKKDVIATNK